MITVYKRELHSLFCGMIGWVLLAVWLLAGGLFSVVYNLAAASVDFTNVLRQLVTVTPILLPFLAAKVFTVENQGNLLWLSGLPVTRGGIVMGKYLAALTVFLIPTLVTAVYPPLLANYGTVSYGSAYAALLGYAALGAAWLAVCCLVAARARRAWVAVVVGLAVGLGIALLPLLCVVLEILPIVTLLLGVLGSVALGVIFGIRNKRLLVGALAGGIPALALVICYFLLPVVVRVWIPDALYAICLFSRFTGFCSGYLDLPALAVYLGVTVAFLLITVRHPINPFGKGGRA